VKFILLLAVCLSCQNGGRPELVVKEYPTRAKCERDAAKIKRTNRNYQHHICIEQSKGTV